VLCYEEGEAVTIEGYNTITRVHVVTIGIKHDRLKWESTLFHLFISTIALQFFEFYGSKRSIMITLTLCYLVEIKLVV
jgi:hypothetical protein